MKVDPQPVMGGSFDPSFVFKGPLRRAFFIVTTRVGANAELGQYGSSIVGLDGRQPGGKFYRELVDAPPSWLTLIAKDESYEQRLHLPNTFDL